MNIMNIHTYLSILYDDDDDDEEEEEEEWVWQMDDRFNYKGKGLDIRAIGLLVVFIRMKLKF